VFHPGLDRKLGSRAHNRGVVIAKIVTVKIVIMKIATVKIVALLSRNGSFALSLPELGKVTALAHRQKVCAQRRKAV
jgi:hypothetical protein